MSRAGPRRRAWAPRRAGSAAAPSASRRHARRPAARRCCAPSGAPRRGAGAAGAARAWRPSACAAGSSGPRRAPCAPALARIVHGRHPWQLRGAWQAHDERLGVMVSNRIPPQQARPCTPHASNASPHPQPNCHSSPVSGAASRAHPGRSILGVMMGCGTVSNLRSSAASPCAAGAAYGLASAPLSVRAEAKPPLGEGVGACARRRR
jgi:hypothetical protein